MSNMWTPPSARSSQYPSQPTDGYDALFRKIEAISTELRNGVHGLLKAAGMIVRPQGLTIDSELLVTGATRIEGTLDLPAGIIGNEALSSPVLPDDFYDKQTGYAVANTYQTKASVTLTTPAGFTKALVTTAAHVRVLNTSGGVASYALIARINGVSGPMVAENVNAGLYGNTAVPFSDLVQGLTDGETFTVGTMLQCSPALTADAGNEATCNGTVLWFR